MMIFLFFIVLFYCIYYFWKSDKQINNIARAKYAKAVRPDLSIFEDENYTYYIDFRHMEFKSRLSPPEHASNVRYATYRIGFRDSKLELFLIEQFEIDSLEMTIIPHVLKSSSGVSKIVLPKESNMFDHYQFETYEEKTKDLVFAINGVTLDNSLGIAIFEMYKNFIKQENEISREIKDIVTANYRQHDINLTSKRIHNFYSFGNTFVVNDLQKNFKLLNRL